ncbi:MAG: trans-aconitate 2-methyltransferase [Desulfovibrio aminophilus]|uniref:class I SAM-dependent methyltransferase n=1 Tax=Desulfovibrio aminophilus TaxID=81425 RepID=UPI0039E822FB
MQLKTYTQRIVEQIRQYQNTENMHAQLSDIFRYWQEKYFKPRFSAVCGAVNHLDFYARPLARSILETGNQHVVSFGCGDAQVEVGVAGLLGRYGVQQFTFHCVELSPAQIERGRDSAEKAGFAKNFEFIQDDFNRWDPENAVFAGAMCHHALHHVVELEHLLDNIYKSLHLGGVFANFDVIGRNGHMRWPEALKLVELIWRFLPEEKKRHHLLKTVDKEYVNRDCSTEGFEGIRSQDILPNLISRFQFETFFAFGNLIDVFTSRGFGANYDSRDALDQAFIDFIEYLNELLIDLGHIKPTRMCAVLVKRPVDHPRIYKHWTPEFCLRDTNK